MIEVIHDPDEIESLANVWNELADRFNTPLLRNEWFTACAEAFCQPGQLHVVIKSSGRGTEAIAPLVLVKSKGRMRLELLGSSFLGEPSGLIYRDEKSLRDLIRIMIGKRRPLILSRLASDSLEISTLRKVCRKKGAIFLFRKNAGSPFLPIRTSWTEFESNMTSRQRYDLRRARNRAQELGKVQFEILSPSSENLDHYFEEMLHVEAAGWKGRERTALLFDERLKTFFYLYSKATSRLGTLRLCFLRINNKPAAALLAVLYFNRFWVLKIGYDETFSRCSPGILLMHETVRYAFEHRLEEYEFLGSDAPWIHMWSQQNHSYITARIYPFSISGSFSLASDTAASVVKRMLTAGNK